MNKRKIREKSHRLPCERYVGKKTVAFTVCVKGKQKLFLSKEIFCVFEGKLIEALQIYKCSAHVYLFMPDHLHLIIKGETSEANVQKCIGSFKQKTGFWLSKNLPTFRWQKDYYDHIVRGEEELRVQMRYILNNPVKANFVDDWKKYAFKGSMLFDLETWG